MPSPDWQASNHVRHDSWLYETCRRRCTTQAILLGLVCVAAAWAGLALLSASSEEAWGPYPIDTVTLVAAKSPGSLEHTFVEVECRSAVRAGTMVTKKGKGHAIWAVSFDDRFLIVRTPEEPTGIVAGVLDDLPLDLWREFSREEQDAILPLYLRDSDPRQGLWIGLSFFGIIGLVFGGFAARSFVRARDPTRHPAIARLAATGWLEVGAPDPGAQVRDPNAVRYRGWAFTNHFMVACRWWKFDVRTWADLAWAYKRSTTHRMYYVIPMGTRHEPVFTFQDGHEVAPRSGLSFGKQMNEEGVIEILELATQRAPWAAFGYDDDLQAAWNGDRDAFCAEVLQRREEILRRE